MFCTRNKLIRICYRACKVLACHLKHLSFASAFIQHSGSAIDVLKCLAKACCAGGSPLAQSTPPCSDMLCSIHTNTCYNNTLSSNMLSCLVLVVTDCEQKLSKLCVHKAMGPDNIPNWILKDFSYILAAPIAAIYNSSVRQSYAPPSWKQADILPIPKVPQVTSLAKHLRPIALTPVLSKVLESFVVSWMRRATVHSESQYGGIRDSSTTLALITMLHHVLQRLERKNTYARIFWSAVAQW